MKTGRVGIIMNGAARKLRGRTARARRRPVPPTVVVTAGACRED